MVDVEVIEGPRRSAKYYAIAEFVYQKDKGVGEKLYVRCINQKNGCPGTAVFYDGVGHVGKGHNHPQDTTLLEDLRLRRRVLQAAVEKTGSLRQIFNDAVRGQPGHARITFEMIEQTMQRRRKELLPSIPADPERALQCIQQRVYPRYSE